MKFKFIFFIFAFQIAFQATCGAQAPAIQWQHCYGGTNVDQAFSCVQTADGGYIIGGISRSSDGDVPFHHGSDIYVDYWLVRTDASGNIQWSKIYGGTIICML